MSDSPRSLRLPTRKQRTSQLRSSPLPTRAAVSTGEARPVPCRTSSHPPLSGLQMGHAIRSPHGAGVGPYGEPSVDTQSWDFWPLVPPRSCDHSSLPEPRGECPSSVVACESGAMCARPRISYVMTDSTRRTNIEYSIRTNGEALGKGRWAVRRRASDARGWMLWVGRKPCT
jgi:hypothetical protein